MSAPASKEDLAQKIEKEVFPLINGLERVINLREVENHSSCEFAPVTINKNSSELNVRFRKNEKKRGGDIPLLSTVLVRLAKEAGIDSDDDFTTSSGSIRVKTSSLTLEKIDIWKRLISGKTGAMLEMLTASSLDEAIRRNQNAAALPEGADNKIISLKTLQGVLSRTDSLDAAERGYLMRQVGKLIDVLTPSSDRTGRVN